MSSRKNASDSASQNGVSFAAGSSSSALQQRDVNYSQTVDSGRLVVKSGGFNGNAVEVWADNSVYDTVAGVFLFPGRDYNPGDLQRK